MDERVAKPDVSLFSLATRRPISTGLKALISTEAWDSFTVPCAVDSPLYWSLASFYQSPQTLIYGFAGEVLGFAAGLAAGFFFLAGVAGAATAAGAGGGGAV